MSETKKGANRMTIEELMEDYPSHNFVAGSLTFLTGENKQAVRITCECGKERQVRTSDLHQVSSCEACTRKARRERQRAKRKAKREEEKAAKATEPAEG
jgi:hypothetical protein